MRISDWSSDVCSSDLKRRIGQRHFLLDHHASMILQIFADAGQVLHDGDAVLPQQRGGADAGQLEKLWGIDRAPREDDLALRFDRLPAALALIFHAHGTPVLHEDAGRLGACRSEEQTSELQSLMRISSAVFCLKKKTNSTYYYYN